jgi:WD40 repeat protein
MGKSISAASIRCSGKQSVSTSEALQRFADLLGSKIAISDLPEDYRQALLLKGIIAALEEIILQGEEGTQSGDAVCAAAILQQTAASHSEPDLQKQSFHALVRLALGGSRAAVDALYCLSVEADHLAARQEISTRGWQPSRPALRALFDWVAALPSASPYPNEQIDLLTLAYFEEASPALQRRLLATAAQNQMGNWAGIVAAIHGSEEQAEAEPQALSPLVERYPSFSPNERRVMLEQLDRLAQQGNKTAQETICLLFIRHEDHQARALALNNGYRPEDPEQQALFYFLSGEWEAYETLDFNNNLLVNAYEASGRSLRRRLLEHSRYTGQMNWLRGIGSSGEIRWISDLTDADWELVMRRLLEDEKPDDLWRLAQVAPPVWSAAILDRLARRGWSPAREEEQDGFVDLSALARESLSNPLKIQPRKSLYVPAADLISLAIHPNGRLLAAGSNDQRIFLWKLPEGSLNETPLIGPAPVTRAAAISPNGDLLASAANDQRIRVFRLQGGQVVKTLEGHRAMIRSLIIHFDGRSMYSAGFDGSIRFWRFPYGPELKMLQPGQAEIFSLALGAGGNHLLSAGADCLVRVWTLPEGTAVREMAGHKDTITHLAASQSSELVASAGRDGMIRIWNYVSGGLVRAIENAGGALTALCLHPNDQVLIGGRSSGEISLWSLSTGREIDRLTGHRHPVTGLVLSPQGDTLYSTDSGGHLNSLKVWDLRTFLTIRLPGEVGRPGASEEIEAQIRQANNRSQAEETWLKFAAAMAGWRQRFDIEIGEFEPIHIGEFDIEL